MRTQEGNTISTGSAIEYGKSKGHDTDHGMCQIRLYNVIVLGGMASLCLLLCWIALWMDPLDKDLTRVGGLLENDYGWNRPQEIFEKPLFVLASSIDQYNYPFQVIVVGDSFSMNERSGWQNYYVAETQKSVFTVVSNRNFVLSDILEHSIFKKTPPDILIYEVAERNLLKRLHEDTTGQIKHIENKKENIGKQPEFELPVTRLFSRDRRGLHSFNLDAAADYLGKFILKLLIGEKATDARIVQLKRTGLFSSKRSDDLLFFNADLRTGELAVEQRVSIIEQFKIIRDRVESNGKLNLFCLSHLIS